MEVSQVASVVSMWAREKPLVKRAYLFGSRVRGDHRTESDIDIALELDPNQFRGVDESGGLATWMFETKVWKEELEKIIPLKVQLERYHPVQTPTVGKGLAQSSQLVYEKAT
ncbi:MAG: nucleotidyltransferase family protein [Pseudomonadota bacterium]